jgi:hypothetical protein
VIEDYGQRRQAAQDIQPGQPVSGPGGAGQGGRELLGWFGPGRWLGGVKTGHSAVTGMCPDRRPPITLYT